MDPFVVDMHTKSGLLDQIKSSTVTLDVAGAATLEFIKQHVPEPATVPLCGNSIGTDRRFLAAYLPEIENYLHYRSIDVSSVKELVKRWYPSIDANRPRGQGSHRALDDIRESIREMTYYREHVFVRGAACRRPTHRLSDHGAGRFRIMRAVVLRSHGGPEVLTIEEVDDPTPGRDEIVVDVEHTAINRADVLQRMGLYPDPRSHRDGDPRARVLRCGQCARRRRRRVDGR